MIYIYIYGVNWPRDCQVNCTIIYFNTHRIRRAHNRIRWKSWFINFPHTLTLAFTFSNCIVIFSGISHRLNVYQLNYKHRFIILHKFIFISIYLSDKYFIQMDKCGVIINNREYMNWIYLLNEIEVNYIWRKNY